MAPAEAVTYDGKRFHQPEPREIRLSEWIRRRLHSHRGPWPKFVATPPGEPPPARVCDGELRVTFINHSTLLVQMDGVNILTDPTWASRAVPLVGGKRRRPAGLRFEDLPPIDAVLVSHAWRERSSLRSTPAFGARTSSIARAFPARTISTGGSGRRSPPASP